MVSLQNLPENLRYFLFKKNLSVKEFSDQINESHSTLLAIIKGKISKTNSDLGKKIAQAIGIELKVLQNELLENNFMAFDSQIPIYKHTSISSDLSLSEKIDTYRTQNQSYIDKKCFAIKTDDMFNHSPIIPKNCYIVLMPLLTRENLRDGDTVLLQNLEKDVIFRTIEIRKKEKTSIISTLTSKLQIDDIMMHNEFFQKYTILGKVIEIRHG